MINVKNRAGRGCAAGQGDAAIRQKPRKKEQYLLQGTALGVAENARADRYRLNPLGVLTITKSTQRTCGNEKNKAVKQKRLTALQILHYCI